jgi:hypothetical protein
MATIKTTSSLDSTGFTAGLQRMAAEAKTFQGKMESIGKSIRGVVGAQLALQIAERVWEEAKKGSALLAGMADEAEQLGTTVDKLNALQVMMAEAGISAERLAGALQKVAQAQNELNSGDATPKLTEAMERLGISLSDIETKDTAELFTMMLRGVRSPHAAAALSEIVGEKIGPRLAGVAGTQKWELPQSTELERRARLYDLTNDRLERWERQLALNTAWADVRQGMFREKGDEARIQRDMERRDQARLDAIRVAREEREATERYAADRKEQVLVDKAAHAINKSFLAEARAVEAARAETRGGAGGFTPLTDAAASLGYMIGGAGGRMNQALSVAERSLRVEEEMNKALQDIRKQGAEERETAGTVILED